MKDSNSIFQITLFKGIIVLCFLYIFLNILDNRFNFFHDNAEFGFWTLISFLIISGFIITIDIAVILLVSKTFKDANKRVFIFIIQVIICIIVYFGLNFVFQNAEKWNEQVLIENKTIKKYV